VRETRGDLMAQIAANNVGKRRFGELADRHGARLAPYMSELLAYAERSMRRGIGSIPNGSYTFEDYVEGDGFTEDLIKIKATVEVSDDSIRVDFTGTDPQVRGPMNARISAARASVYYALKCVIDPDLPTNHGAYRPIEVVAEEGSLVQARFPAAVCNANILTDQRLVDVVLGALVEAVPDRVVAACSGEMNLVNLGGIDDRTGVYYNYVETYGGGQGAMIDVDGMDGVHTHMTNTRNTPVEVIESTYPFRVERYGLVPDTEGAGCFRGGLGIAREIVLEAEEATFSLSGDRQQIGPWGVRGGESATPSECTIVTAAGKRRRMGSKVTTQVHRGDRIIVRTPGGGGWGRPPERDPEAVARDVRAGYITRRRARETYGAP
jgi:N-methylhydantoinase B